jgi:hypothetical protein
MNRLWIWWGYRRLRRLYGCCGPKSDQWMRDEAAVCRLGGQFALAEILDGLAAPLKRERLPLPPLGVGPTEPRLEYGGKRHRG